MHTLRTIMLLGLVLLGIAYTTSSMEAQTSSDRVQKSIKIRTLGHGSHDTGTILDESLAPFYHGVASGDPLQDGFIIWTRVALETDEDSVVVQWHVSLDTARTNILQEGTFTTSSARDYTVKVDIRGLQSGTTYYYWFTDSFGRNSLVGRARTASENTDHLKFAVVSCQSYPHGFFNAYGRIANRNDIDAVLHLGDYIYEYANDESSYGGQIGKQLEREHAPENETVSLGDYRSRYGQYRLDPDLRRAHQQQTFIAIWDDHETANDSYKDGAQNHNPEAGEGEWETRKSVGRQAYFEWLPIRETPDSAIYRSFQYGNLAELVMLDTRIEGREEQILDASNPDLQNPDRTMLGAEQFAWFTSALSEADTRSQWKIIGNQVLFMQFFVTPLSQQGQDADALFLDVWNGYPAERQKIITHIAQNDIDNVMFMTGDFHSTFSGDIAPNPFDSTVYNFATGEGSVAVEFATPSISSANFDENLAPLVRFQVLADTLVPDSVKTNPTLLAAIVAEQTAQQVAQLEAALPFFNRHVKNIDLDRHGYFMLDVTPQRSQADYYYIPSVLQQTSDETFALGMVTLADSNRLSRVTIPSPAKAKQEIPAPDTPPVATSVEDKPQVSSMVVLSCQPNPATDIVYINFSVQKASNNCSVTIHDERGNIVTTLLQGRRAAGVYTLEFDVSVLAKGSYFYQFSDESTRLTRRFVVVR